jgi:hypothetical protein
MPYLNKRTESYVLSISAADMESAVAQWDPECYALIAQASEEAGN